MTTETTCLSSIWRTDEKVQDFYAIHGRPQAYKELNPGDVAYYDGMIEIDLGQIKPMIAMPFHPSNTYTIEELNANLMDILDDCEKRAEVSFDGAVKLDLKSKVRNGKLYVDQGIIAGCAGGGFENICDAADILKGASIGPDEFTLSVYPASTRFTMELVKMCSGKPHGRQERSSKQRSDGPCFGVRRYSCKQRILHPPLYKKLPEPRRFQGPEGTGCIRCAYGCKIHCSNCSK